MNRKKIGISLFWLGLVLVVVWQALTWYQGPAQRVSTADELSGTLHAIWGALFTIRIVGGWGVPLALLGVLLYTGKKGSYFWLLGLLPSLTNFLMYWNPNDYIPALFGIGGTVILISYFGILWIWTRTYSAYEGVARTGRQIQLLGYSTLFAAGNLLCMYFGNPNVLALANLPVPSGLSINLTLSLGMLLLFVGHYVAARPVSEVATAAREPSTSQEQVAATP